jgi:hypothetical protein
MTRRQALIGATLLVLTGAATAQPAAPEASIPFANRGGIYDWHADKDRGLWVQDVHRNWYYAKFMGPCIGLDFANSIAFDTRPIGTFDKFSTVRVPGAGRCTVQSFTVSESPYPKKDHKS